MFLSENSMDVERDIFWLAESASNSTKVSLRGNLFGSRQYISDS